MDILLDLRSTLLGRCVLIEKEWYPSPNYDSCGVQLTKGVLKFYCNDDPKDWPTKESDPSGDLNSTSKRPK